MKIHLLLFAGKAMIKTFESDMRPVKGDIVHDPGFHPKFHNGYEVAKVTLHYAADECWVSLAPLVSEREDISLEQYTNHLLSNGWRIVSKEEMLES